MARKNVKSENPPTHKGGNDVSRDSFGMDGAPKGVSKRFVKIMFSFEAVKIEVFFASLNE